MILSSYTWGEYDNNTIKDNKNTINKIIYKKINKQSNKQTNNKSNYLFNNSLDKLVNNNIKPFYSYINKNSEVNWNIFPNSIQPDSISTYLPNNRINRKKYQVNNLINPLISMINAISKINNDKQLKIVEFCCGSGFIGLPIAFMYPQHEVVLIDLKENSLNIAKERNFHNINNNVRIIQQDISLYNDSFDIGIALHACGSATDICLQKCINNKAAFVFCPCCIGKITLTRQIPLSTSFNDILNQIEFKALVKAADFGHSDLSSYSKINQLRRITKCYIEYDRMLYANSYGYDSHLLLMQPTDASPKNDIIIGWYIYGNNPTNELSTIIHKDLDLISNKYKLEELLFLIK